MINSIITSFVGIHASLTNPLYNIIEPTSMVQHDIDQITCMAYNSYFEARGEGPTGMVYVAWTVLNRIDKRKTVKTPCEIVFERNRSRKTGKLVSMYSWIDRKSYAINPNEQETFMKSMAYNTKLYYNHHNMVDPTGGATHFHAKWMKKFPSWAKSMQLLVDYKNHLFYG